VDDGQLELAMAIKNNPQTKASKEMERPKTVKRQKTAKKQKNQHYSNQL